MPLCRYSDSLCCSQPGYTPSRAARSSCASSSSLVRAEKSSSRLSIMYLGTEHIWQLPCRYRPSHGRHSGGCAGQLHGSTYIVHEQICCTCAVCAHSELVSTDLNLRTSHVDLLVVPHPVEEDDGQVASDSVGTLHMEVLGKALVVVLENQTCRKVPQLDSVLGCHVPVGCRQQAGQSPGQVCEPLGFSNPCHCNCEHQSKRASLECNRWANVPSCTSSVHIQCITLQDIAIAACKHNILYRKLDGLHCP